MDLDGGLGRAIRTCDQGSHGDDGVGALTAFEPLDLDLFYEEPLVDAQIAAGQVQGGAGLVVEGPNADLTCRGHIEHGCGAGKAAVNPKGIVAGDLGDLDGGRGHVCVNDVQPGRRGRGGNADAFADRNSALDVQLLLGMARANADVAQATYVGAPIGRRQEGLVDLVQAVKVGDVARQEGC